MQSHAVKDLSVRTEIEEFSSLPKCPTAARISEIVAQLEELMGRMNPWVLLAYRASHMACRADSPEDLEELQGDIRDESCDPLL